jgi:hypothetical protein
MVSLGQGPPIQALKPPMNTDRRLAQRSAISLGHGSDFGTNRECTRIDANGFFRFAFIGVH